METLNYLIVLSFIVSCSTTNFAQSHKIIQQNINTLEVQEVSFIDIAESHVKVEYTDGEELFVKNDQLMGFLAESERYKLFIEEKDGEVFLSIQNGLKTIELENRPLREYISYTIYVPKKVNEVAFINKNERNPWQKVRQARKVPRYWVAK